MLAARANLVPALCAALLAVGCALAPPPAQEEGPAPYQGALRASPNPVPFGDAFVGCVRSVTVELSNSDDSAPLVITRVGRSRDDLGFSGKLPLVVNPGRKALVDLHFKPARPGDMEGVIGFATTEGQGGAFRLPVTGRGVARPEQDLAQVAPLDLVFVLDVSTTMDEMASLRGAIVDVFEFAEQQQLDIRFGLVTFVNDIIVHRDGAFLDRAAFFEEFDSQLVPEEWVPDPKRNRQLVNFDFAENQLGALHRAATDFDFRPRARRYFLLMTDATFDEPPAVFSDGTEALHSYEDVEAVLAEREVRLFSVHASESGRGLSANHEGRPSLVTQTRGTWFELAEVSSGKLTLDGLLADLVVGPPCD